MRSTFLRVLAFPLFLAAAIAPSYAQEPTSEAGTESGEQEALLSYRTYDYRSTTPALQLKSEEQRAREQTEANRLGEDCESGDILACNQWGEAYEKGLGVPQNRPIAAELYYQACAAGLGDGCRNLGRLYEIAEDDAGPADAVVAYEQSCILGTSEGCIRYAELLEQGRGVAQDSELARAILQWRCDLLDQSGCRALARVWGRSERGSEAWLNAFQSYERLCQEGDAKACEDGISLVRIYDGTFDTYYERFLFLACREANATSCGEIGRRAIEGDGLPEDQQLAREYFDRACELDNYRCYASNALRGVEADPAPCAEGDAKACLRLVKHYGSGSPIADDEKLREYLLRACELEEVSACHEAANRLFDRGAEPNSGDAELASEYLQRACTAGIASACKRMAIELRTGKTLTVDLQRSIQFLREACDLGDFDACLHHQSEVGVQPDGPLPEADQRFMAPLERDAEGRIVGDGVPDSIKQLLGPSCTSSELEFRGQVYEDLVCKRTSASIGASRTRPGAVPWQALIWRPARLQNQTLESAQRVLCGGSIIQPGWILTAAHCVYDQGASIEGREYRIRVGVFNPRNEEGISYPIGKAFAHPSYDSRSKAYDIALIKFDVRQGRVDGPSNGLARIRLDPLPVETRKIVAGKDVYSYGWGWTSLENPGSTDYLQSVRMQLQSPRDCQRLTEYPEEDSDAAICAVGPNGEQSCRGDSGGPLITYSDPGRRPTVIGVVSWGYKCGVPTGSASAFTRVAKVKGWIDRKMRTGR